ncbi:DUF7281 domain-containing protein [Flammeovirga aprica]|uniref:DUF7281 domain-containing protein n=1 Tax=Flammeovirga aprica JL-4 TaxID=694437 RepID=A0A7X9XDN2_9BACT|nr:hypothetical protein [Flammeovirga aprica]NME72970.1 hypothetical protein [Flammeovirga aprica JL-4]
MKLSESKAKKLLQLSQGEVISGSQLKGAPFEQMLDDGILQSSTQGRTRRKIACKDPSQLKFYLKNQLGINDLLAYIDNFKTGESRADNIKVASDSKSTKVRTFKGFLVNCYEPISAVLNGTKLILQPAFGSFLFISDFENFTLDKEVTIVGVENAENFKMIEQQSYLFEDKKVLFVSRYPQSQSKDLIQWLQSIPNSYLHYGDFDFEGIGIFQNEYQKYIGERASFFIPPNIEGLLQKYGNRNLYDLQLNKRKLSVEDERMKRLVDLFHHYKKCLEQEVLIGGEG